MREVFRLAKDLDIPVSKVSRHELNLLSDDRQHQVRIGRKSCICWSSR